MLKSKQESKCCPEGKYWVPPYKRKKIGKNGKSFVEEVKGYCASYHSPFYKLAEEEKLPLDLLYFALTIYGEARNQNDASQYAIAWIVQNRFKKSANNSYQKVVLQRTQFSCWIASDPNYQKLKHPGKEGSSDNSAWLRIKVIAKDVQNAPENKNPIPGVYNYFSGKPKKKWQEHYFDLPNVPNFHFVKFK